MASMRSCTKGGKKIWAFLDKLGKIQGISVNTWKKHFQDICHDEHEPRYPLITKTNEVPLDYEITMGDLKDASYVLKNNKVSGEDMISNGIIKCIY